MRRYNKKFSGTRTFYHDNPITRTLPGNHPSLKPSASLRSMWVTELAWHVQWYCYARVAVAEAVKPQLPWLVSTALISWQKNLSLFNVRIGYCGSMATTTTTRFWSTYLTFSFKKNDINKFKNYIKWWRFFIHFK